MSLLYACQRGDLPALVAEVAHHEGMDAARLARLVAEGRAVITSSRRVRPVGIGDGLRRKFAVITGTSSAVPDPEEAISKARVAGQAGASAIHEASTTAAGNVVRHSLLNDCSMPVAFCQGIHVAALCEAEGRDFLSVDAEEMVSKLEEDAASGAEILVGPFGMTREMVDRSAKLRRAILVPNRTGALMLAWIRKNRAENPYVASFDRVLRAASQNDVILSFLNAFRPGAVEDALDELHVAEMRETGRLVQRAHAAGVQVKVGNGGHVPFHRIPELFGLQKQLCYAPVISFGPVVTDIALGYDHVVAAIGQCSALTHGADMILTVTAAEHLSLPTSDEVLESCHIARYVCHAADIAIGLDCHLDRAMSEARQRLDWCGQLAMAFDETRAQRLHARGATGDGCSMCGSLCALRIQDNNDSFAIPSDVTTCASRCDNRLRLEGGTSD